MNQADLQALTIGCEERYVKFQGLTRAYYTPLVNPIERRAKQISVRKLYLYTRRSEGFYERLGWRVKEETIYHNFPVTIMEKEIVF